MSILLKNGKPTPTQAGFAVLDALKRPWVDGYIMRGERAVPRVRTELSAGDRWGSLKARWGIGRMRYAVLAGLYAAGRPTQSSPVFVSANYKMSFDALRSSLGGIDAWILVLDTKGINVWCAAGKGSFGTDELVGRLASTRLSELVNHRRLVLPQLGAPGVSAQEVARRSGFRVSWGPVRAKDITSWLKAGMVKDEAMRTVTFTLRERLAVAPVEIAHAWPVLFAALLLGSLYGLPADGRWLSRALPLAALLAGAVPVGTIAFPVLLPWLPGRAFSVKGAALGAAWALSCAAAFGLSPFMALAWVFLAAPLVGFFAMNFTGASTFTCQPGALLEVEKGFWPMVLSALAGVGLALGLKLLA